MLKAAIMAAGIAVVTVSSAHAEEPFTREACIAYITSPAPAGLGLNPNNIPIGTMVFGEPVFKGMHPNYLCEREVRVRTERTQREAVIAQLTKDVADLTNAGANNRTYREEMEKDFVVRHLQYFKYALGALAILVLLLIPSAQRGMHESARLRRRTKRADSLNNDIYTRTAER